MDQSPIWADDRWQQITSKAFPMIIRPAALGLAACLLSSAALAHAHLKAADPAAGSRASASPTALSLTFSEVLEAKLSSVTLKGPDGKTVPTGAAALDAGDGRLMRLPLKQALGPGKYTVEWHALSRDGHSTRGTYQFTIAP
jgi:methionine-rich copper-binding protein CopC